MTQKTIADELKSIDERLCALEKKFDYIIELLTRPRWSISWKELHEQARKNCGHIIQSGPT